MDKELEKLTIALNEVVELSCLEKWYSTPNKSLENKTPIEIIKSGNINLLWDLIHKLKSGQPG